MKKTLLMFLLLVGTLLTFNFNIQIVEAAEPSVPVETTQYVAHVPSFGSVVSVYLRKFDPKSDEYEYYLTEASKILTNISKLSDDYRPATGENSNNVYYINNNPGIYIEVKKELYDLIDYSVNVLYDLTEGYFDISIGAVIKAWKDIIEGDYTEAQISQKITNIENMPTPPPIKEGILFKVENGKYYIKILEGIKIDLGAIAKGYGVDKVYEYFKSEGINYFHINGGASSLKYASKNDTENYNIGITNPLAILPQDSIYGEVFIENTSLTTSGDTLQNHHFGDRILHHIISPKTRMPENFYRSLSIVHPSATFSDALTTALFSMDEQTFNNFVDKLAQTEEYKLQGYITFGFDGKINANLDDLTFEFKTPNKDIEHTLQEWLVVSAIIVIVAISFYIFKDSYDKKQQTESSE